MANVPERSGLYSRPRITVRELLDRYGAAIAFVSVFALLVVLLPSNTGDDTEPVISREAQPGQSLSEDILVGGDTSTGPQGDAGASGDRSAARTGVTEVGQSGDGAADGLMPPAPGPGDTTADGTVNFVGTGPNCRNDGRTRGIEIYSPPCVAWIPGADNGGATSRGVSRDEIVIAAYDDSGQSEALRGLAGSIGVQDIEQFREDRQVYVEALRRYFNNHIETYGREVVIEWVPASGTSDQAHRADAAKMADEVGAFASLNSPTSDAFLSEAGARSLMTFGQGGFPRRVHSDVAKGLFFARSPVAERYFENIAEFVGKALAGKNAEWAGDPLLAAKSRKFGLIYEDSALRNIGPVVKYFEEQLARYGIRLEEAAGLSNEPARAQEQAINIMAKMRAADVSTVIYFADFLGVIHVSNAAERQQYHPEWFVSGSWGEDANIAGRAANQNQWRRAFAFSWIYMYWNDYHTYDGVREIFHGDPTVTDKANMAGAAATIHAAMQSLWTGIHMAGPNLATESFVKGLYEYPCSGGQPWFPTVCFSMENPVRHQDLSLKWWDPAAACSDEFGVQGLGCMRYVDGGARFGLGRWPTDPPLFDRGNGTLQSDWPRLFPHEDDGHVHETRCMSCP